jgi:ribosomal protein S18 acetylase RimI-like enzyme
MKFPFRLEALRSEHDRASFQCGHEALDRYLQTQATQDVRRRIAACFVAIEVSSARLAGYYTIAAASIPTTELPIEITRRLPRYPSIPAVRVARLAVDIRFRRQGLGAALLADALRQAILSPPAVFALVVDAKDEPAVSFYLHHGFLALATQPKTLFLPVATARKLPS